MIKAPLSESSGLSDVAASAPPAAWMTRQIKSPIIKMMENDLAVAIQ